MIEPKRVVIYKSEDSITTKERWGYQTTDSRYFLGENSKKDAIKHQKNIDREEYNSLFYEGGAVCYLIKNLIKRDLK